MFFSLLLFWLCKYQGHNLECLPLCVCETMVWCCCVPTREWRRAHSCICRANCQFVAAAKRNGVPEGDLISIQLCHHPLTFCCLFLVSVCLHRVRPPRISHREEGCARFKQQWHRHVPDGLSQACGATTRTINVWTVQTRTRSGSPHRKSLRACLATVVSV